MVVPLGVAIWTPFCVTRYPTVRLSVLAVQDNVSVAGPMFCAASPVGGASGVGVGVGVGPGAGGVTDVASLAPMSGMVPQ